MKIAIGADMQMPVLDSLQDLLLKRGHSLRKFGVLAGQNGQWSRLAVDLARAVAEGDCDMGVVCCWTGTGVSMAANKVSGIRAALCHDSQTAAGARQWNDANVLALSLRTLSSPVAEEILDAWFENPASEDRVDRDCIDYLNARDRD